MDSHGVIRLRLLGAPAIEGPAADGQAVLKQPKRLLLLAFLATREEFVTRDALVGLFWPSLSEHRARRALSQAIHFLRSDLGRASVLTRGSTEVAVGDGIQCDIPAFERAIHEESWESALDLYGGELLSGVIPQRAPELEQWLESDRATLRRQAIRAANALSHAAFQAGDLTAAIAWRRRTLEISPFDESAHKDYFALLDEAGDAAGALAAYERFRTQLHEVYELEPSAETLHVIDLIRSRHSGPDKSERAPDPSHEPPGAGALPATSGQSAARRRRISGQRVRPLPWLRAAADWRPIRVSAVLVVATLATLLMTLGGDGTRGIELNLINDRVAVLYLGVNGQDPELRNLADGLTETLIGYLGKARSLDVVSSNGVRPFRGLAPPLDTISSRLRAKTIIDGSVLRSGGKTRVNIDVIDAETGSISRHFSVESASDDMLQIIDDVAARFSDELSPVMGDLVTLGRWKAGTENSQAWRHVLTAAGLEKAGDKQYDLGNTDEAGLAYDAADWHLVLAGQLDPNWLEPTVLRGHLALSRAYSCIYDAGCDGEVFAWINRAIGHAETVLSANEVDAGGLELKGRASLQRWMVAADPTPGLLGEAERVLGAAVTLDPSRASAWAALSAANFASADFEGAETSARVALEEDAFLADRAEIQMRLFQSAFHRGHDQEAERWCDGVRGLSRTGNWLGAECAINLMAWSSRHEPDGRAARLEVVRGLQHMPSADIAVISPRLDLLVAAVFARAGEPDNAKQLIERALSAAHPDDQDILYYAAGAYAALNDEEQAVQYLSAFLKGAPEARSHVARFRWFSGLGRVGSLMASQLD